ncbi:hypothetical protein HELRODRAFT_167606 [Helobdella robusta]|uniref:Uncharacterized protein n=1 Tax=Helobdella robusta TaxID=6412 RepID=T1EZJ6_HELRO|nr:hypothetical protein HELRODRAFT_167606 [Helobdella robusta]ESO11074.1 hypothetical protein HELRODRAFT_167606 [Helobdella robusta]
MVPLDVVHHAAGDMFRIMCSSEAVQKRWKLKGFLVACACPQPPEEKQVNNKATSTRSRGSNYYNQQGHNHKNQQRHQQPAYIEQEYDKSWNIISDSNNNNNNNTATTTMNNLHDYSQSFIDIMKPTLPPSPLSSSSLMMTSSSYHHVTEMGDIMSFADLDASDFPPSNTISKQHSYTKQLHQNTFQHQHCYPKNHSNNYTLQQPQRDGEKVKLSGAGVAMTRFKRRKISPITCKICTAYRHAECSQLAQSVGVPCLALLLREYMVRILSVRNSKTIIGV